MKNNYIILLLSLLLLKTTTGICTSYTISAAPSGGSYIFTPDSISANVGDTIKFSIASIHSALEVDQATWSANSNTSNGGFAVPYGGGMTVVNTAKIYYYVCQNHYAMRMKGRIFVTNPNGINSLTNTSASLEIFPNPVSSSVTVKSNLPAGKANQLRVFDMSGKCVYQANNISPIQYLDLTTVSSGVYFVAIKSDDIFLERKLIVSR